MTTYIVPAATKVSMAITKSWGGWGYEASNKTHPKLPVFAPEARDWDGPMDLPALDFLR